MAGQGEKFLMRFGVSFFALAVVAVFVTLWQVAPGRYFEALFWLGDVPYHYPFLDLETILQAGTCARSGVDVYAANACMHGGSYNYSPLLLRASLLPIGTQDRVAGGLMTLILFSLSLSMLPLARDWRALLSRCFAVFSPATIFGAERGNFDLLVFCMVVIGVILTLRHPILRWAGYLSLVCPALLKFYPAATLILLLKEPRGRLLGILLPIIVISGVYFYEFWNGTITALRTLPGGPPFGYWFGSTNLAYGFALLRGETAINLSPNITQYRAILLHGQTLQLANLAVLVMTLLAAGLGIMRAPRAETGQLLADELTYLVAGAAVLCCCFFEAQNVVYREIFFLFILPAITSRRKLGWLMPSILFLMWEEALRRLVEIGANTWLGAHDAAYAQVSFWLFRELVWWRVIIELTAVLVWFGRTETRRLLGVG